MRKQGNGWSVAFTLLVLILHEVKASGKLDLKFHSFSSSGKGSNGNCCESNYSWIGCNNQCDPKFTLCVDESDSQSIHDCSLLKQNTGVMQDQNNIVFGTDIGGTSNRFVIDVASIPSKIKVKVEVYDDDPGVDNYHMDNLATELTNFFVNPKAEGSVFETYTLQHRTTLKIQFRAYCDLDWYDSVCEIYCKPQNDELGHYICHERTGEKICNMGWKGDNCEQNINECDAGGYCQNNADCEDFPGSFKCKCRDGFGGMFCEDITHQCATDPCVNGGICSGNETAFNCACPIGWSGDTCAVEVDPCDAAPCRRGTCMSNNVTTTRFSCACESGWTGATCEVEVDPCDAAPCRRGTCMSNNVTATRFSCAYSCFPLYLEGKLGTKEEDIFNEKLRNYADLMGNFSVTCLFSYFKDGKGGLVTEVTPVITVDGQLLDPSQICQQLPTENLLDGFSHKKYLGSTVPMSTSSAQTGDQVLGMPVIALIAIGTAVGFDFVKI